MKQYLTFNNYRLSDLVKLSSKLIGCNNEWWQSRTNSLRPSLTKVLPGKTKDFYHKCTLKFSLLSSKYNLMC